MWRQNSRQERTVSNMIGWSSYPWLLAVCLRKILLQLANFSKTGKNCLSREWLNIKKLFYAFIQSGNTSNDKLSADERTSIDISLIHTASERTNWDN